MPQSLHLSLDDHVLLPLLILLDSSFRGSAVSSFVVVISTLVTARIILVFYPPSFSAVLVVGLFIGLSLGLPGGGFLLFTLAALTALAALAAFALTITSSSSKASVVASSTAPTLLAALATAFSIVFGVPGSIAFLLSTVLNGVSIDSTIRAVIDSTIRAV